MTRRARPAPTGPGDSPGFLLWRTTLRWQRDMAAALAPLGLTHVQFVLLASTFWLSTQGDAAPSQRQVSDHTGTDVMTTSQVLRTLERKALVTRVSDSSDARVRRVSTTEEGARLAREATAAVEEADNAFFTRVPDQAALVRVLRELAAWRGEGPRN